MKQQSLIFCSAAIFLICCIAAIYPKWLDSAPKQLSAKEAAEQDVLYLPSGEALKIISLGYQNALANFFWFTTINYFGKHYRSDQSYEWLAHRCNLIQELDPHYVYVAEFCALILAYEAQQAEKARDVLNKALIAEPEYWRLYYLLGMNYLVFEKDDVTAQRYFVISSNKPEAEPFVARLAAKKAVELNQPELALNFLSGMIGNSTNEDQKSALIKHYQKTYAEIHLAKLEAFRVEYEKIFNRPLTKIEDLLTLKIAPAAFRDPWNGRYYFDTESQTFERQVVE